VTFLWALPGLCFFAAPGLEEERCIVFYEMRMLVLCLQPMKVLRTNSVSRDTVNSMCAKLLVEFPFLEFSKVETANNEII